MFMYCVPIPHLQCVCATQPFPKDDARKNSTKTHWSGHTLKSGPEVKDEEERVKKQFIVEVKNHDTLGRNE